MGSVKPIPEGFRTLNLHLAIKGAAKAIEFYKKAFNAEEIMRMPGPDGQSVMHAELKIGDTMLMLADECPEMEYWKSPDTLSGTTVALSMYVEDCDKVFQQAVDAGAKATMPPMDMFWGDRYSKVTDPFGHQWEISTHKQDLTPEEIAKGAEAFFSQQASCAPE